MAIAGIGCRFQKLYSDGWADVAEVMSVDGPNPERDTYDTTTINTDGNYRTFIPGLKDGGEVSMEMNYTEDSYSEFKQDFDKENEDALLWYSVVFNDNDTETAKNCIVFQAMVTSVGSSVPTDDKVSSNVTLKVSGNPEYVTVATRNAGNLTNRSISPSSPPLAWRGFLTSVTVGQGATTTLPSAFGGTGAITYVVRNSETNLPSAASANAISFNPSTRVLSVGSSAETSGDIIALVYTATDSTTPTAQFIRQGIILTIG